MIKIKRAGCPGVLKDSPSTGKRYKNPTVVATLWKMQHGKCCYCEQYIPEKGHLKAVEHFSPKSVYKKRRNDWKNLLLACAQCNGQKSDKFPTELTDNSDEAKVVYQKRDSRGRPLIIDPSDTKANPEDHIGFVVDDRGGDLGNPKVKSDSPLGRTTINTVGLHGQFYVEKRQTFYFDTLIPVYYILLKAKQKKERIVLQSYKDKFVMFMSAKGEFAAFARAFARDRCLNEKFGIRIPVGAESADDVMAAD